MLTDEHHRLHYDILLQQAQCARSCSRLRPAPVISPGKRNTHAPRAVGLAQRAPPHVGPRPQGPCSPTIYKRAGARRKRWRARAVGCVCGGVCVWGEGRCMKHEKIIARPSELA